MSNFTVTQKNTEEIILMDEKTEQTPPEKKRDTYPYLLALSLVVALCLGIFCGAALRPASHKEPADPVGAGQTASESPFPGWITEAYLTRDGASRTGEKLEAVRDIAVHYVANPGTSAMANRNYFEGPDSNTSSHFIVGLEGEILVLIPTDEQSCATNARNVDTISIEVCHPDEMGKFSDATYQSLIRLLAYLCREFDLNEENLIRHYDVTGKLCPRYYVENPDAWDDLKTDVKAQLERGIPDDAQA